MLLLRYESLVENMNFLKTFFLVISGSIASNEHGHPLNAENVCGIEICDACAQNALARYEQFCSHLLRIPNCCIRYFGHRGPLMSSVDHHEMTRIPEKPAKSSHIPLFVIFLWIIFVFLLISVFLPFVTWRPIFANCSLVEFLSTKNPSQGEF